MNVPEVAGGLLILALMVFAIGATLPAFGARGNMQIFTLPVREHLDAVGKNPAAWRRANMLMGAGFVLLLAGMTMLTSMLQAAGEQFLSALGLTGLLLAAVLWLIFSAFRAVTTVRVAKEVSSTGEVPLHYELLAQWGYVLFQIYIVLGCLALTVYGASLLQVDLMPMWVGWSTIMVSMATLGHLLITGDTLPAFHYFPPLLIGILLLMGG